MKYKKIIFVLIVFLFILLMRTDSFASFELDNHTFPDLPEKTTAEEQSCIYEGILYYAGYGEYWYIMSSQPFYYYVAASKLMIRGSFKMYSIKFNGSNDLVWSFKSENSDTSYKSPINPNNCYFPYLNHDVCGDGNNSGTVFFQASPLPLPVVELTGTLAPVVATQEMDKVLAEIVGILPSIIVVVVSLVGLRKGLTLLSKVLRRCLIG